MGDEYTSLSVSPETADRVRLHKHGGDTMDDAVRRTTELAPRRPRLEAGCAHCDSAIIGPEDDPAEAEFVAWRLQDPDGEWTPSYFCGPRCLRKHKEEILDVEARSARPDGGE